MYVDCACEGLVNHALTGTPYMSSQYDTTLIASNMNDDITNNNSLMAHTGTTSNTEWVEIDLGKSIDVKPVSYTHLTLPTICSV